MLKYAAHGRDEPGLVRPSWHQVIALRAFAPTAPQHRAGRTRDGEIHLASVVTGGEPLAQFLGAAALRGLDHENGRELAGKDGLSHFHDVAARFTQDAASSLRNHAGAVT